MEYKRYPSYRDSGIEWLGEVPEHWTVCRLSLRMDTIVPMRDKPTNLGGEIPWIRIEDFDGKYITRSKSNQGVDAETISAMNLKVFPKGTILCSCSCNMGKTAIASVPLISNQTFIGLVPENGVISDYAYFLMQSAERELSSLGTGAIQQYLSRDDFRALRLPFPPIQEQHAIAVYLDHETNRIDALIEKKQRLIELLKEKRQAVITQAVTKGLDPNVPMKDSGVEWLGEVPEHWELTRLGWTTTEINDINHEMPKAVDDGVPFLSAKDLLDDGTLNFEKNIKLISEEDFVRLSEKVRPQRNDIIYSRIGARLGKARLVETEVKFLISYSCCVIRPEKAKVHPEYLAMYLDNDLVLTEAKLRTVGIGVPDLGLNEIARFRVPLPPLDEQRLILDSVQSYTKRLMSLIQKAERSVNLAKEHRSALITAAVTGQIDVRNVA